MSKSRTQEDYIRYLQEKANPRIRELNAAIHAANQRLNAVHRKISRAQKERQPAKRLNQLIRERDNILRSRQADKDERNAIRSQICTTDREREVAGSGYILREKRRYCTAPIP